MYVKLFTVFANVSRAGFKCSVQSSGEYVQELKNVSAIKLISATPRPTPTNFLNGMYECPPGNFSK